MTIPTASWPIFTPTWAVWSRTNSSSSSSSSSRRRRRRSSSSSSNSSKHHGSSESTVSSCSTSRPVDRHLCRTGLAGPLRRHPHQVPWSSDISPTSRMSTCYLLQIALQVMSNWGFRCSLNKGSCRRSSDAMVTWRSQIDVRCVCNQGPQTLSRPGLKCGTKSSKNSRSFDQVYTCSLWCEGWGPIREQHHG